MWKLFFITLAQWFGGAATMVVVALLSAPTVEQLATGETIWKDRIVQTTSAVLDRYCEVPEDKRLALRELFGGRIVFVCP